MKNIFRKRPMQQLEATVATLAKRGDQLVALRTKAQDTLDHAIAAQQDRLLSGDIDDQRGLDKLRDAVVSAKTELSSIEDALAVLAQQKSEAEAKLATELERAERVKASGDIDTATDAIEARVETSLPVMRELGDALVAIDYLSYEAGQLGRYLLRAGNETELALAFVMPELRRLAQAVKEGHTAIPRSPQAPEPIAVERTPAESIAMGEIDPHPNFIVLDRSAENRTLQIEVPRL
jgi:hypothetical protein